MLININDNVVFFTECIVYKTINYLFLKNQKKISLDFYYKMGSSSFIRGEV